MIKGGNHKFKNNNNTLQNGAKVNLKRKKAISTFCR